MRPRVLRKPFFGWGFRQWRREAASGLVAAWLVIGSWGAMSLAVKLLSTVAGLIR